MCGVLMQKIRNNVVFDIHFIRSVAFEKISNCAYQNERLPSSLAEEAPESVASKALCKTTELTLQAHRSKSELVRFMTRTLCKGWS